MDNDCMLSVFCLAYNHEKYIRKTLEGFVNQKTKYKYEVIVHDDASTDGTADIIREFAEKYPEIIKPIFQTENQYSKNVRIFNSIIKDRIHGKYIAACEGDDYWCDEEKIEIQIDYLENHPECSLCVHDTEMMQDDGKPIGALFNNSKKEIDYSAEEIIEFGAGNLFQLSSYMYLAKLRFDMPDEFRMYRVGDYPLAIYLATMGYVHFIPRVMSRYRLGVSGSWTSSISENQEAYKKSTLRMKDDLAHLDELLDYKYNKSFEIAKERFDYYILVNERKLPAILKNKQYRGFLFEKGYKKALKDIVKMIINR